ncbi:hypothetical protein GJ744_001973 [Endocarpon pusillum]|uniref:Branched-chain-amino-acid aminotransferase n=1 Tax=Endocarpon pusillum TaxID=364733 RepID=A0A8H7ABI1_9EURO|nr:hypothetical protein GJ744_001973 [Endocarpon pusillum]
MAIAHYANGEWQTVAVTPFSALTLHPESKCFQYKQTILEGMEAFKTLKGRIFLFRPKENARRFNQSASRIAMHELPEELFVDMVKALVWVERDWFPRGEGSRL